MLVRLPTFAFAVNVRAAPHVDTTANLFELLVGKIAAFLLGLQKLANDLIDSYIDLISATHAFDYSGSQFDAYGRADAVFNADDVEEFLKIRQKIADCYSTFEVLPGTFVDGEAVSAEATADLCGLQAVLARAHP